MKGSGSRDSLSLSPDTDAWAGLGSVGIINCSPTHCLWYPEPRLWGQFESTPMVSGVSHGPISCVGGGCCRVRRAWGVPWSSLIKGAGRMWAPSARVAKRLARLLFPPLAAGTVSPLLTAGKHPGTCFLIPFFF